MHILGSKVTVHDVIRWLYLFTNAVVHILGSQSKVTVHESRSITMTNHDIQVLKWLTFKLSSDIILMHILGSNVTIHDILICGRPELGSYHKILACELYDGFLCGQTLSNLYKIRRVSI